MNKIIKYLVLLFAIIFIVNGIGWLILPEFFGEQLDMKLLEGAGLSSQIGDIGSFFTTMGICILLGLKTRNKIWFYPAILLPLLASFGRIVAWLFHDAALPIENVAVEIVVAILLYYTAKKNGK